MLIERGLFEAQAEAIIARAKADPYNEAMQDHWQDNAEGYPERFMVALWHSVRQEALVYTDEYCPRAWFRPVFADTEES